MVSAHRLYRNPLWWVACQRRWVGRSIKRDPWIKLLPRATASVNSTRAHPFVSHAAPSFARMNRPLVSSARVPTTAASLRVGCVVLCVSRTHGLPPFNPLCTITHERAGLGWGARLTAGSRAVYLWPPVPGGGFRYQLYLSRNAEGFRVVIRVKWDLRKCTFVCNFLFFPFFTAEDADSSEVIDHGLISGRLIGGITRKQLTVGCRSVNTHDDSLVSVCHQRLMLLSVTFAVPSVLVISLAWDTCERISF